MGAGLRYHSAVSFFLIAFPALFSIINPLGGSFIFLSATDHYPRPVRAQLALWVSIYSFAIVTGSVYIGAYVLEFFGIRVEEKAATKLGRWFEDRKLEGGKPGLHALSLDGATR